jgi:hypothetical protein
VQDRAAKEIEKLLVSPIPTSLMAESSSCKRRLQVAIPTSPDPARRRHFRRRGGNAPRDQP